MDFGKAADNLNRVTGPWLVAMWIILFVAGDAPLPPYFSILMLIASVCYLLSTLIGWFIDSKERLAE